MLAQILVAPMMSATFTRASTCIVSFCSTEENLNHSFQRSFEEEGVRYTILKVWDKDDLLMEALSKLGKGLIPSLYDFCEVYTYPPFLATCYELAHEAVV